MRTLALPSDLLEFGPHNVVKYADGRRNLRFRRGKTNIQVEIELVGDLAAALDPCLSTPTLHRTFIRGRKGRGYTVDGIGSMFRRYARRAEVADFGLRDLRAMGATTMYRSGADIRHIQHLLGHRSVRTTEIYLKQLLAEIVRPNEGALVAGLAG